MNYDNEIVHDADNGKALNISYQNCMNNNRSNPYVINMRFTYIDNLDWGEKKKDLIDWFYDWDIKRYKETLEYPTNKQYRDCKNFLDDN